MEVVSPCRMFADGPGFQGGTHAPQAPVSAAHAVGPSRAYFWGFVANLNFKATLTLRNAYDVKSYRAY